MPAPALQSGKKKEKGRHQQEMIEPGGVKEKIRQVGDPEGGDHGAVSEKAGRRDDLVQPVAGDSGDIPEDDAAEKKPEGAPAGTLQVPAPETPQQVAHAGEEEQVADLVGNQSFSPAMDLDRQRRSGQQQEQQA